MSEIEQSRRDELLDEMNTGLDDVMCAEEDWEANETDPTEDQCPSSQSGH